MAKYKAKLTADEWNALPDAAKELYVAASDGGYIPDVEGIEDVAGLKSTMDKLKKDLAKFKDIDPDRYREAQTKLAELQSREEEREERLKEARGEWDSLKTDMSKKHAQELSERDKQIALANDRISAIEQQYEREMIERVASQAIASKKGDPVLLMPHIHHFIKVVKDDDGNRRITVVDPTKNGAVKGDSKGAPLTIDGLLDEWRGDPHYSRGFEGTGSSGGGSPNGGVRGSNGANGPHWISRADAQDTRKYRFAKEAAEKAGQELQIEADPRHATSEAG
jgi:cellobiose-specific phosphotransferase system component IIB